MHPDEKQIIFPVPCTFPCSLLGVLLFSSSSKHLTLCICALSTKSRHDFECNNVTPHVQIQLPREDGAEAEEMDTDDQVAQATSSDQVGISWLACAIHYNRDIILNP